MLDMLDPNRLNRVHVLTVRGKDDKYLVILTDDKDEWAIAWDRWITLSEKERRTQ